MLKLILLGGAAGFLNVSLNILSSIIVSGLAVRTMSAYDAGIWFVFFSVGSFLVYCDLGLSPAMSREVGFAYKKHNISIRVANLFKTINRAITFLAIFFAASLILVVGVLHYVYAWLPNYIFVAFCVFIVGAWLRLKCNPYLALIYSLQYVHIERNIRSSASIIWVASVILLLHIGLGLLGLCLAWVIRSIALYIAARSVIYYKKLLQTKGQYTNLIVNRIFEPCVQWTLMSLGSIFLFQTGNFLLAKLISPDIVPQYSLLLQITTGIIALSAIFQLAIIPFYSRSYGEKKHQKIKGLFFFNVKGSVAVAMVLAIFFSIYLNPVMHLWVGNKIVPNHLAFLILMITAVLEAQHVASAQAAMACNYVKFAKPSISAGLICVVLSVLLIKFWGVTGAALAVMLAQLSTNNWYSVFVSLRHLRIKKLEFLKCSALPLLAFFLMMLVSSYAVYLLLNMFRLNVYLVLLISAAMISLLACCNAFFLLFSRDQKRILLEYCLKIKH